MSRIQSDWAICWPRKLQGHTFIIFEKRQGGLSHAETQQEAALGPASPIALLLSCLPRDQSRPRGGEAPGLVSGLSEVEAPRLVHSAEPIPEQGGGGRAAHETSEEVDATGRLAPPLPARPWGPSPPPNHLQEAKRSKSSKRRKRNVPQEFNIENADPFEQHPLTVGRKDRILK